MTTNKLNRGLAEAVAHAKGGLIGAKEHTVRVPDNVDVRSIRQRLGLSQQEFAVKFGFSISTIRNWEQGARVPHGPTRSFLIVIERDPKAVMAALAAA